MLSVLLTRPLRYYWIYRLEDSYFTLDFFFYDTEFHGSDLVTSFLGIKTGIEKTTYCLTYDLLTMSEKVEIVNSSIPPGLLVFVSGLLSQIKTKCLTLFTDTTTTTGFVLFFLEVFRIVTMRPYGRCQRGRT